MVCNQISREYCREKTKKTQKNLSQAHIYGFVHKMSRNDRMQWIEGEVSKTQVMRSHILLLSRAIIHEFFSAEAFSKLAALSHIISLRLIAIVMFHKEI